MTWSRNSTIAALVAVAATAGLSGFLAGRSSEPRGEPAKPAQTGFPGGKPIDAAEIQTGKLSMERMPDEVGKALESQSQEIVKTAEILATKQARVTGTCPPGAAIRVIAADGSVSCQKLARGVVSVSALTGLPRLPTTTTTQGNVAGGLGRYQTGGPDDYLVVPLLLPDGAVVTSFAFSFYDADPLVEGAAYLYRSDDQVLAKIETTGADVVVRRLETEEIRLPKVEAGAFAYFVYFQLSTESGGNTMPISATVGYRIP
ncbi:MAG: hypothetical protein HZB56_14290 [Deltaproteobacteria bacterium]|nr:hypothetical protein [Deltaproteobacteria bacterium]